MSTRKIVKNIRSSAVIDGKPKLPQPTDLDFGEIAINYAKGYETLSFKNNSDEIVSLSVKTVDDVKVNGNSVVSNKTAEITMKGNTIPVANTYSTTTFPSPFESKAEHISATDKVNVALKKVETNISKLVSEVVDNENVVSEAISKLANSAGTIDGSNNITYIKATNAHYIKNATSVHDATVKLDDNVYSIKRAVDDIGNNVDTLNSDVYALKGSVNTIKGSVNTITNDVNTIERNVTSIGGKVTNLENNVTTITSDVNTLKTQVTNLDSKYRNLNNTDINLQDQITTLQGQITTLQGQITTLQGQISSIPTMEFVDLGLPSGTMWAKCNIGATSETDYGNYFMWGSTTPNTADECTWTNAPFNGGSSDYNDTHFNSVKNTVCPNGILAKGYDVAYKTTNGAARMPTDAEFLELINNTDKKWTHVNSVDGWKFISKTDTSKYIFIPAAGFFDNSNEYDVGTYGYVWSSSLMSANPGDAWCLESDSGSSSMTTNNRCYGMSVRAVRNLPL